MNTILMLARKEMLLLSRDLHGLLLLFIMPCAFIIIMSFALDSSFKGQLPKTLYLIQDHDGSNAALELKQAIKKRFGPAIIIDASTQTTSTDASDYHFQLTIHSGYEQQLIDAEPALNLLISASADESMIALFQAFLYQQLSEKLVDVLLQDEQMDFELDLESSLTQTYDKKTIKFKKPTALQQSVPAWLLFAMFFITIPLSNTLISERQQGTLQRLHSIGVSNFQIYAGKLGPYFCINMLQAFAMLAVGLFLMPALGGETLQINGSVSALVLLTSCASLTAINLALVIATIARTSEQATISAGVLNLIMAALGGVMVPRFLMPEAMQAIGQASPMAWGLQGFLDVLLHGGGISDVVPEAGVLIIFAILFSLTLYIYQKLNHD